MGTLTISGDTLKINFTEILDEALVDLSKKSRNITYTIMAHGMTFYEENGGNRSATLLFYENSTGKGLIRLGYFEFEKDKFNCLTIGMVLGSPDSFTYKTCKTLNSEPMMRYAFDQFVDHFGKKYKNNVEYHFRYKVS